MFNYKDAYREQVSIIHNLEEEVAILKRLRVLKYGDLIGVVLEKKKQGIYWVDTDNKLKVIRNTDTIALETIDDLYDYTDCNKYWISNIFDNIGTFEKALNKYADYIL